MASSPVAWVFDVDGCLVDALSATSLRPLAVDVLTQLRDAGVPVVAWSAGGGDYARRVLTRLGVGHLVDACYDKVRGPHGRWVLDGFADDHRPAACVDDDPGGVPDGVRVIAVPPYLADNPHNRGLAAVLDAIKEDPSLPFG